MNFTTRIPQRVPDHEVDRLWASASDQETFLRLLREHGATKIECIRTLRNVAHIGLGEAKEIVHFSPTWADRRASDDAFHDAAEQAIEALQREEERNPERLAS